VVQCDEANKEFCRTDCCNKPVLAACVQGGWPQPEKYGFTAGHTSGSALTWDQVKNQIGCLKAPFAFSWHYTGDGGHMMVAIGYTTAGTSKYVEVNDPGPPDVGGHSTFTYDYFVSGPDNAHWDDYYNFKKK
jgi:hypothetical protein